MSLEKKSILNVSFPVHKPEYHTDDYRVWFPDVCSALPEDYMLTVPESGVHFPSALEVFGAAPWDKSIHCTHVNYLTCFPQ